MPCPKARHDLLDQLTVDIKHNGLHSGNLLVKISLSRSEGANVLEGVAKVAQPTAAYVFTGQGSQKPSMGMDPFNNSPAARAVWEGADAHLSVYGFSIIDIVEATRRIRPSIWRYQGQEIRERYMEMTYDYVSWKS